MAKRHVHFSSLLAEQCHSQPRSFSADAESGTADASLASSWYSQKELKHFRLEIMKIVASATGSTAGTLSHDTRGLEMFMSRTRKELQSHFVRTIIETQRRIKRHQRKRERSKDGKSIPEEEVSLMIQKTAVTYSQYARDRAHQVAIQDAIDSRNCKQPEAIMPNRRASQSLQKSFVPSATTQYSKVTPRT